MNKTERCTENSLRIFAFRLRRRNSNLHTPLLSWELNLFSTMVLINQFARAAVRPAQWQRRTFLNWMVNYPDRVS
jgi:hypothetical protein